MNNLFAAADRQQILDRLSKLQAGATRQWGKMDSAQMLAHCAAALEVGTGDRVLPHRLIGRIFGPFVKGSLLGEKPFSKNSPTDPAFIVSDARDFAREKARLVELVNRFGGAGPSAADGRMHSFFGRLKGDEWGASCTSTSTTTCGSSGRRGRAGRSHGQVEAGCFRIVAAGAM